MFALSATALAAQSPFPPRITDSIPGMRISWDLVPVPGDTAVYMMVTEVPWELYDMFYLRLDLPRDDRENVDARTRPSRPYGAPDRGFGHRGYPAISLTHGGATRFATWLSEKTGHTYRVPTQAQWERAAALAFANIPRDSLDAYAWHAGNADGTTHPLKALAPDALGLFDLFGNAGEWVTGADNRPRLMGGSFLTPRDSLPARETQQPSWNQTDPQDPKSRWWLSDGPFAGLRLVRLP